jgi:hypothetical protein
MTVTPTPAKTPTVAIARILRAYGLKQGSDFCVSGIREGGERVGTRAAVNGTEANELIAVHADEIESAAADLGFPFQVSVYFTPSGTPWVWVANTGERVRQTHFLSDIGRDAEPVAPELATAELVSPAQPAQDEATDGAGLGAAIESVRTAYAIADGLRAAADHFQSVLDGASPEQREAHPGYWVGVRDVVLGLRTRADQLDFESHR